MSPPLWLLIPGRLFRPAPAARPCSRPETWYRSKAACLLTAAGGPKAINFITRPPGQAPGLHLLLFPASRTAPAAHRFMKRTWLLFSQTVTVLLAAYFVVATLKPQWLDRGNTPGVSVIEAPAGSAPRSPGAAGGFRLGRQNRLRGRRQHQHQQGRRQKPARRRPVVQVFLRRPEPQRAAGRPGQRRDHQRQRLHPDQQPRGRGRRRDRGHPQRQPQGQAPRS
jgi:hypothetical protein